MIVLASPCRDKKTPFLMEEELMMKHDVHLNEEEGGLFSLFTFLSCTNYFFQRHAIYLCLNGVKVINKGSSKSWVVCMYYIENLCSVCQG